ncbi:MAG TPA: hypothetical protein VJU84_11020 [Pyrinomonadaceae bacterium]|nr:hypothetical protein [Pyrinomonadaceae bacterium]
MDGVILFVDDKIDTYRVEDDEIKRSLENELFDELRKNYPVLGVRNLDLAQEAIRSIGSFKAIILDWVFDNKESLLEAGEDRKLVRGVDVSRDGADTLEFLKNNEFYSLIYVFSNEEVNKRFGRELRKKFQRRIKFRKKGKSKHQAEKIAKDISAWNEQNQNLKIPNIWTKTINQSVQKIFLELANADEDWIRELGKTAKDDGVGAEIFIIEILQYLLAESLIQDTILIDSIRKQIESERPPNAVQPQADDKSVARLFRRIFYTKLDEGAPVMTGDICKLRRDKYGIIVTPECDIKDVVKDPSKTFELLTFSKDSFDSFLLLQMNDNYEKRLYQQWKDTNKGREKLKKLRTRFNNGESKYHILPSFPFASKVLNDSVAIDLSAGCERFSHKAIKNSRSFKLNAPFIQQLRQRYISHLGRVGTPSLPQGLRNLNLQ